VAIATPATYVKEPLKVFELDFEANLPIVRSAHKYGKHLVFPSTSEVYGMSPDAEFDPESSPLVYGPINKPRWIYACAKQLMDRVIWGYGMEGLRFTLFRPFNWIGPGLDSIYTSKEGSSRVVTQFLGHIARGEPINLVDGGSQKRAFTYIDDGIDALSLIIENKNDIANGKIYNIGNPLNNHSVKELANMIVTFTMTLFAWIFFRAESVKHAIIYISEIFSLSLFRLPFFKGFKQSLPILVIILIFIAIEWIGREDEFAIQKLGLKWNKIPRWSLYFGIILLMYFYSGSEQQFIYFQF
jgi:nucleoside-diphosphate-sugar epimerase